MHVNFLEFPLDIKIQQGLNIFNTLFHFSFFPIFSILFHFTVKLTICIVVNVKRGQKFIQSRNLIRNFNKNSILGREFVPLCWIFNIEKSFDKTEFQIYLWSNTQITQNRHHREWADNRQCHSQIMKFSMHCQFVKKKSHLFGKKKKRVGITWVMEIKTHSQQWQVSMMRVGRKKVFFCRFQLQTWELVCENCVCDEKIKITILDFQKH